MHALLLLFIFTHIRISRSGNFHLRVIMSFFAVLSTFFPLPIARESCFSNLWCDLCPWPDHAPSTSPLLPPYRIHVGVFGTCTYQAQLRRDAVSDQSPHHASANVIILTQIKACRPVLTRPFPGQSPYTLTSFCCPLLVFGNFSLPLHSRNLGFTIASSVSSSGRVFVGIRDHDLCLPKAGSPKSEREMGGTRGPADAFTLVPERNGGNCCRRCTRHTVRRDNTVATDWLIRHYLEKHHTHCTLQKLVPHFSSFLPALHAHAVFPYFTCFPSLLNSKINQFLTHSAIQIFQSKHSIVQSAPDDSQTPLLPQIYSERNTAWDTCSINHCTSFTRSYVHLLTVICFRSAGRSPPNTR